MSDKSNQILNTLEQLGCIVRVAKVAVEDAALLAKALRQGGIPAVEVVWDCETGSTILNSLRKEGILIGAAVKTIQEMQDASNAGADWVACVEWENNVVVQAEQLLDDGTHRARIPVNTLHELESVLEEKQGEEHVQLEVPCNFAEIAAAEIGKRSRGCCFFSFIDNEISQRDWAGITTKCKDVVKAMLQLRLHHIGIDCVDQVDGMDTANRAAELLGLSVRKETPTAYFVDSFLEIMKGKGAGHKGHISVSVPCIQRAIGYLEATGTKMSPGSGQYNSNGELFVMYLEEEIGGFALHLIQPQ